MKKLVSASEMASYDKYTIEEIKIPSLVLMERAALACVNVITDLFDTNSTICVVCGPGNNGADGVAIARILKSKGYANIFITVIGDESKYTLELRKQIEIAKNLNISFISDFSDLKIDVIVDALFGIGLSRDPSGVFETAINKINSMSSKVLSVDIPSGICADTGKAYSSFVNADYTVTFQYIKKGLLLSQGYISKGELTVADIGIVSPKENTTDFSDKNCYLYEEKDVKALLPDFPVNANKGSRGKVLVIAGSESIYGACYLSAKAALKTGCGMVKVYTHKNNIAAIQENLPEAMYSFYEGYCNNDLARELPWADVILIGPGISTGNIAKSMVEYIMKNAQCPVVIDADAINILSQNLELIENSANAYNMILTPHLKEMSRLCQISVSDIQDSMEETALAFRNRYGVNLILKNFTSFIVTENGSAINTAGNQSMATAGSGDVLAGITASLVAQGCFIDDALPMAAYLHGKSGEKAAENIGMRHVTAEDIINNIDF